MTQIQPFDFDGSTVRVVTDEHGGPWFALVDLCTVLGIGNSRMVAARLADDEKGVRLADTPGGRQKTMFVNEPGMWSVIVRSDSPAAEPVRRWVTHDVLPAIRKTGSYGTPALTGPELMAAALIEANRELEARDERIAAQGQLIESMKPRAQSWDHLAATDGDYSMRDAAQILDRHPGISTGQNRLSKTLREIGWVDRQGIPYQRQVDCGRLRSRARYYTHRRTGERVLADPQIRITPKGVSDLQGLLAGAEQVLVPADVVAAGEGG